MKPRCSTGGDFKKAGIGTHLGICYRIVDCGTQPIKRNLETVYKPQLQLAWEIHGPGQVTDDGQPLIITNKYVNSCHEAANIAKMIKAWTGIVMDANFPYESLLGKPAFLGVTHKDSGGVLYANITGVMSPPPGYPIPPQHNPSLIVSLAPEEFHQDAFDALSEKMRKYIAASPEHMELVAKGLATPVEGVVAQAPQSAAQPIRAYTAASNVTPRPMLANGEEVGAPPPGHPANETDNDPNAIAAYGQFDRG